MVNILIGNEMKDPNW